MKVLFAFTILFCLNGHSQNYQWAKRIIGACGSSIVSDASGNVYVAGSYRNTQDFDPGPGTVNLTSTDVEDIYFAKYSAAGSLIWAKSIGGANYDIPYSITIDQSGNVYLTGYFRGTCDFDPGASTVTYTTAPSTNHIFIAKYDNNGNYIWAKKLASTGEGGSDIAVDVSGNVYVSGEFTGSSVDFDPGPNTATLSAMNGRVFFAKYDANGNYVWAKNFGNLFSPEDATSIAVDNLGNVYLTGYHADFADYDTGPGTYTLASAGLSDVFFSKYDTNGNFIWANLIGSSSHDKAFALTLDGSNNVCITGYFSGTVDFDPGPNTATLTTAGGRDAFFAKYDPNGNYLWAKSVGGLNDDMGTSIGVDGADNIYINGYYGNTANFDSGNSTATLTTVSTNTESIYFAKYDSNGNYIYAAGIAGHRFYNFLYTNVARGLSSMDVSQNGDVHITNYFSQTADFDPGVNSASMTIVSIWPFPDPDAFNAFIAKYSATPCSNQVVYNPQTICAGMSYAFNNQTYSTSGVYNNTLQAQSGCDSVVITQLTVNPLPIVAVSGSSIICIGASATFTANGANTFSWSNNQTGASIVVSPVFSTTYTVFGTDANGCVGTSSVFVAVDNCSGIEEGNDINNIIVYPNPVKQIVGVKILRTGIPFVSLNITTVQGQRVFSLNTENIDSEIEIDMSGFASGLYFLVAGENVVKLIKE